jgi:methionine-rich copper-binding protein CopC
VRRLARIQGDITKGLEVKITGLSRFLGVVAILSFLGMSSASANSLITTLPISGSTVTTAPTSVTLTTQVALLPDANDVVVTNPAGVRVDDGTITINDVSATVGLKPLENSGIYRVTYNLFAEGETPLEGSFTFNYSAPSVITPSEPTPEPTKPQTPASSSWGTNVFIIILLIAAFIVLIGLSLYARKLFRNR